MFTAKSRIVCVWAILLLFSLTANGPAIPGGSWVEQGPGPTLHGQSEGLLNNPVAGAISAIAVDPSDPSGNTVYVGAVNGGIWKTTDATAPSPTWTPLTDLQLPALSINSLAISPVRPSTLFAGTGSTSSLAFLGSPGFGVARSINGGKSWTVLASSTFDARRINSIVPTALDNGNVVLAATLFDEGGVYRSSDKAASFTQISGGAGTGLPRGGVSSLVADPGNSGRFYAGVPSDFGGGFGNPGVYRSDDGGLTWTWVSFGLTGISTSLRILLSIHNSPGDNVVYAAVITSIGNKLTGVFRSTDQGRGWTAMGVPSTEIFPGGQGFVHGAIAADPTNPNVVFVSGDFGGTFRGDAFILPGNPWASLDHGEAHGTSPHVDSRAMVFDTNGDLIQANDGGIYRLRDPNNEAGLRQWFSMNGNIRPAEFHTVAYDPLSNIVFGGTQDNGTTIQSASGRFTWNLFIGGDGGVVAVDSDQTAHPGTTIRYTSFQGFGFFNRSTWDAANNLVSDPVVVGLRITSGPGTGLTLIESDVIQFYQPYVLNAIDPSRMLIGTTSIYESFDRGDSLANLGFTGFFIGNFIGANPMAYGARLNGVPNPDVFYVGAGPTIRHRVTLGASITTLSAYPGANTRDIVMDPKDYRRVFVVDDQNRVWGSLDEGASWIDFTANLPSLSTDVRTIEFLSPDGTIKNSVLIVGGLGGVFQMRGPGVGQVSWTELGKGLPNGFVLDLHYDASDDVLVAGTLGRGAWTLSNLLKGATKGVVAIQESAGQPNRAEVGGLQPDLPSMPPEAVPPR